MSGPPSPGARACLGFTWIWSLVMFLMVSSGSGCRSPERSTSPNAHEAHRAAFAASHARRIFEPQTGEEISFDVLIEDLSRQEFILVGETHLDDETHRFQQQLFAALLEVRGQDLVLSLEMFERDVQPVLDAYLDGSIDEPTFLSEARPWPNYATGYRGLVELARSANVAVVAANLPRELRMKFAMGGPDAANTLTEMERAYLPEPLYPASDVYWQRVSSQLRDHMHGVPTTESGRLYAIQNLWDNSMAEAAVEASRAGEGRTIMHVAGAFHVEYGLGTTEQILRRRPKAKLKTLTLVATHDLAAASIEGVQDRADYVVFVPARARGPQDGQYGVTVPAELRYRLQLPRQPGPYPLLVWLTEDGTELEDELAYWSDALEGQSAVVVVEPAHLQRERDLRIAGRWWWPSSFGRDLQQWIVGIPRIIDYVAEYYDVDRRRVVVAGAGAGASVALWTALYGGDGQAVIAARPVASGFGEASLGGATRTLGHVSLRTDANELAGYRATLEAAGAGQLDLAAFDIGDEPKLWDWLTTEARTHLGLGGTSSNPGSEPALRLPQGNVLARQWGRIFAQRTGRAVVFEDRDAPSERPNPKDLADGVTLPRAPGAFGGTTLLVIEDTLPASEAEQWFALADPDVIHARDRFSRLVVCRERELPGALQSIIDAGRRNVLVVPAIFVANPRTMQRLADLAAPLESKLDLQWLAGLGAAWSRALK